MAAATLMSADATGPVTIGDPTLGAPNFRGIQTGGGKVHDNGATTASLVIKTTIKDGIGSTHIPATAIKDAIGVACSDGANTDTVTIEEVSHDMKPTTVLIGGFDHGNGDPIETHADRESYLSVNGGITYGHYVSHQPMSKIDKTVPIRTESDEDRKEINHQALTRAENWHAEAKAFQMGESMDHDVRRVEHGGRSRVLIPVEAKSATAKHFMMNRESPDFHGGSYDEDNGNVVVLGADGPHLVVQPDDYAGTASKFLSNLKQKTSLSLKDGYLYRVAAPDGGSGTVMTRLKFDRTPMQEVLKDDFAELGIELDQHSVLRSSEVKSRDGEAAAFSAAAPSSEEQLQAQIFQDDFDHEDDEKPLGPMTIKPAGGDAPIAGGVSEPL